MGGGANAKCSLCWPGVVGTGDRDGIRDRDRDRDRGVMAKGVSEGRAG